MTTPSPSGTPPRPEVLAFLEDIKEHPDDDTPRLVLADWLEDHGDPDRANKWRRDGPGRPGGDPQGPGRPAPCHRTRWPTNARL
jgi:uncharacterized protein (TIGR02996 family)